MEKEDNILVELRQTYSGRDWYHSVGYDQYGRPVIYIKYECHETIYDIPDYVQGKQLMAHFASSVASNKEDYFVKSTTATNGQSSLPPFVPSVKKIVQIATEAAKNGADVGFGQMVDTEEQERELELSVRALTDELDRIEKLCGTNILQDIFYEIHDGTNAVTNLSARFPEVQQRVRKLYDRYGFDTIYEELDG